jgi:hypothetical protein
MEWPQRNGVRGTPGWFPRASVFRLAYFESVSGLIRRPPRPAKFATILLGALPVMFVSYQLLVRYSVIGAVLNGRRIRKTLTSRQVNSKPIVNFLITEPDIDRYDARSGSKAPQAARP